MDISIGSIGYTPFFKDSALGSEEQVPKYQQKDNVSMSLSFAHTQTHNSSNIANEE